MAKMISINEQGGILASEPITVPSILDLMFTGLYNIMQDVIAKQPEDEREKAREDMYDMFNLSSSAFLSALIPDKELRPDLTAEAILEMENKILEKKVEELNDGNETEVQETEETEEVDNVVAFQKGASY